MPAGAPCAKLGICKDRYGTVPDAQRETERQLEQLHGASFGWALACCGGDEAEAADALQDAYLKILDGRARFGGRSSFRTFLFGVIRLTALERKRKLRVRATLARAWGREPRAAESPAARVVRSERTRLLSEALRALSRRQREVLHLVFYEEMTIQQASEVLGTSLGTARTHYERGKRRLRELLAAYLADDRGCALAGARHASKTASDRAASPVRRRVSVPIPATRGAVHGKRAGRTGDRLA